MRSAMTVIFPNGDIFSRFPMKQEESVVKIYDYIENGYLELIGYFNEFQGEPCQAWCHEEGKIRGFEVNEFATVAWQEAFGNETGGQQLRDILVGPVVILTGEAMLD